MEHFSDRIVYMMHDDDTDQPYVYYIKGDRLSLQIDAGNSPASYSRFQKGLSELGLKTPDLLVLTHWHWDHTFGLRDCLCPVISSEKTREYLEKVITWKWDDDSFKERLATGEDIEFCYERMHVEYQDLEKEISVRSSDIWFEGKMTVDLGGITAEFETMDTPHTRDALMIYVPEEKALFGGDAEYEDYYDNDSQYDPQRLKAFIDYLEAKDFNYYMRGHDDTCITKSELLKKLGESLSLL